MNKGTTNGAGLIAAERQRQVSVEGWTPEHDDRHRGGQIASAAIAYTAKAIGIEVREVTLGPMRHIFTQVWPWRDEHDKRDKHSPLRCLVIAGALIAAEIDRRLRAGEQAGEA